jgi:dethiobiotin synthase
MPRGLFIAGTDTGVGKTVVAAALMHRYRREFPLRYWKPIQTGIEEDDDTATVRRLGSCELREVLDKGYRLPRPVSPHLAARLNHVRIRIADIETTLAGEPESSRWLVEGAGGVLVPINDWELMIDVMVHLSLPVVIVSRSGLGTINHTLLTLEAIRGRSLQPVGIVMLGEIHPDNREALEEFGRVAVIGEMPWFSHLTPHTLEEWATRDLDRDGRLSSWLS